ncbi:MAG: ATP-binding protein [Alphaproteobacteria bacterium]|nr:ATP-binding protein [Alphaproteobacteria bacterium]
MTKRIFTRERVRRKKRRVRRVALASLAALANGAGLVWWRAAHAAGEASSASPAPDMGAAWAAWAVAAAAIALAGAATAALVRNRRRVRGLEAEVARLTRRAAAHSLQTRPLQAILDNAPFAIYLKDAAGRYQVVNRCFAEHYDADPADIVGKTAVEAFGEDVPESMLRTDAVVLQQRRAVTLEATDTKRSSRRRYAVTKFPVLDDAGAVIGLGGVDVDITERSEVERALKLAKEEAELANRAKSDFLANMSHEIRTPLNAILGFAELMREQVFGPLGAPRYEEYADDIYRSGKHLLEVIGDILDLSKIEAGKYEVEREVVFLRAVAESALGLVRPAAQERRIALACEIPEGMRIEADRRAVKQILLNLLSNAVKFTPEGGRVALGAERAPDGAVRLSVSDSGVGVAEADIARIMEPFTQVGAPMVRRGGRSGSGIGLTICKRLATLMGARLAIDSRVGEGTTIALVFPPEASRAERSGGEPPPEHTGGVVNAPSESPAAASLRQAASAQR